jgi:hypothetical protein
MLTHNNVFVLNHAHDATTIYATTQLSKVAALLLLWLCMLYSCFYVHWSPRAIRVRTPGITARRIVKEGQVLGFHRGDSIVLSNAADFVIIWR